MEFDTQLDYLTCTWRCPMEWDQALLKMHQCVFFGSKQLPWRFLGYSGYSIRGADGHVSYGKGKQGGIIQASGEVAAALCR